MIGIEWDVPASLNTNAGTLNFNVFPGLILVPDQCSCTKTIRAPIDPIPQGDGDILHRRYQTGYQYKLVAQAWETESEIACAPATRTLGETLGLHLFSMLRSPGRYCWLPTNYGDRRALDQAYWFAGVTQTIVSGGITQYEWEIDSPFPYVIDLTQTSPSVSGVTNLTNSGNTDFYPVIQIQGPAVYLQVYNLTTGEGITYDSLRPGARTISGYGEIDSFKGTIYENGNGADLSAGIDPTLGNLEGPFRLIPGVNQISVTGGTAVFLLNNAWS